LPKAASEEGVLPVNFGDIVHYNKRIAARYYLRAQIERDCGKYSEAEYHTQLAVRYVQAALEQKRIMSRTPGHSSEVRKPRPWTYRAKSNSVVATLLRRLAGGVARGLHQIVSGREAPLQTLSLD
jgi:hypothetical protein